MGKKIVAIMGSYRKGGIIDQAVGEVADSARAAGAAVKIIYLLDKHIEFCTNCRVCTQTPGEKRGNCVHNDDMSAILDEIEAADGIIIGAPVNFYSVNALTKRFMERLAVYAYWPWGKGGPKFRRGESKKAVLITSGAAPAIIGRIFFSGVLKALKAIAKTLGAKPIGTMFIGMAAMSDKPKLSEKEVRLARDLGGKLI